MASVAFAGFRPELIEFLKHLGANNTREWFQQHRLEYEHFLLEPAREFVLAMGERFSQLDAAIHAEPRVHGSIFAINRDTRFSTDKTPYKTYLDLWFWQGDGPSRERPGYFLRLMPECLVLGAGMHAFSPAVLERYRQAVVDPARGAGLEAAAEALRQYPGVELDGGRTYKRVPPGLPADHPRAEWLRHSSLFAACEQPVPDRLFSDQFPSLCFEQFERLAPLQRWLVDLLPA
jgi:uncharacterized protein (TIGR02453 family)